ncbi:hypothetical protein HNV12_30140 [Methanococcoides sp. SA1]|nr:hypothetical protein [Methanococcoides sp. SA1]
MSIQKIRSRFTILEKAGLISKQSYKQYFIIVVTDFDQYLEYADKLTTILKPVEEEEIQNDE